MGWPCGISPALLLSNGFENLVPVLREAKREQVA
jgi:hypothetical protein